MNCAQEYMFSCTRAIMNKVKPVAPMQSRDQYKKLSAAIF